MTAAGSFRAQYIGGEHIAYTADGERIVVGDARAPSP